MFPVMVGQHTGLRAYVPWMLVTPHEAQAQRNHGQSLDRLAERGGLSAAELVAVLEDRRWKPMDDKEAWRNIVAALRAAPAKQEPAVPEDVGRALRKAAEVIRSYQLTLRMDMPGLDQDRSNFDITEELAHGLEVMATMLDAAPKSGKGEK